MKNGLVRAAILGTLILAAARAFGGAADLTLTGVLEAGGQPRGYFRDPAGESFSLSVGQTVGEYRLVGVDRRRRMVWVAVRGETNELGFARTGPSGGVTPAAVPQLQPVVFRTTIEPPDGDPHP